MDTTPFFADITMSELKKKELKDLAVCSPYIFGTAISYKHLVSVSLTIFAFFTAVRLMTRGSGIMAEFGTSTLRNKESFNQAHTSNTLAGSYTPPYYLKYHKQFYINYLIQYLLFFY